MVDPGGTSTAEDVSEMGIGRIRVIGLWAWAGLFSLLMVLEGLGLVFKKGEWPTMSDMLRTVTRPAAGRWLLLAVWLWLGWHLFIRGQHFFLRGHVPSPPAKGGAGHVGLVQQVIIPLVGFYVLLVMLLLRNRRPARAPGSVGPQGSEPQRGVFDLRLAVLTVVTGYVVFVAIMTLYSLVAGSYASGFASSAAGGGAFLAFAVALPAFALLSWAERAWVRRRGSQPGSSL